jgi:hypothetical protein
MVKVQKWEELTEEHIPKKSNAIVLMMWFIPPYRKFGRSEILEP